jgi:CTP-dependent riboflavin kinase
LLSESRYLLTHARAGLESLLCLLTELTSQLLLSTQSLLRCLAQLLTERLLARQLLLCGLLN